MRVELFKKIFLDEQDIKHLIYEHFKKQYELKSADSISVQMSYEELSYDKINIYATVTVLN